MQLISIKLSLCYTTEKEKDWLDISYIVIEI